ncbi:MAG: SprB repeat-containing protein, partial [Flavobacteriales bacterium]
QCGNSSSTFVQTIQEATDLSASLVTDEVTCHGGSDGQAVVSIEGGVAPYTVNWGGYDPGALEAGNYSVTVFDDNLCQQSLSFLITEPSEFSLELTATVPDCNDPNSGTIEADVIGYGGPVELNWGDANPDMAAAGEYTVVATDTSGCFAVATVVVDPADIPEDLELNGNASVAQGDSAAYYYEYTLGSNYTWTYTGAEEQQVFNSFAISLMWTDPGFQEVCVTETNQDGCTGNPVCMEVFVEDDVWSVEGAPGLNHLILQPNVACDLLVVQGLSGHPQGTLECWSMTGQKVLSKPIQGRDHLTLDVTGWASGQYLIRIHEAPGARRFTVQH